MCTGVRFNDDNGNFYFGRNLDWAFDFGQSVVVAPRDFRYTAPFLGEQTLQHGALIGMAIIEENTPLYFDCMSEGGLAVAGLNFPTFAAYAPGPIDGKTNVAAYEFPLWLAANFTSVAEVKATLPDVTIVAQPINSEYPVSNLHWLVGDKTTSIVVEYTERGMEIFDDPVDVLTNQPGFAWHTENLRNHLNLSSDSPQPVQWGRASLTPFGAGSLMRSLPGDTYSTSRFVRAAFYNTHYPAKHTEAENISRLFHTLASTAMIEGSCKMEDGRDEYTTYTGGYSSASQTYYFNTYDNLAIRGVSLGEYDLTGSELMAFAVD